MNAWINPFLILNGYFVFSSIQASSRFLSGLRAHLLSGLDSTCALLIKQKQNFRLPKERDCSSFFFCSCCCLCIYTLFIPLQPECHKNIHSFHIFSIQLKCGNCQCAQWLGGWIISHIFHYGSSYRSTKNLYVIWTLSRRFYNKGLLRFLYLNMWQESR